MTPLALITDPPGEAPPTDAHLDWLRGNGRGDEVPGLLAEWHVRSVARGDVPGWLAGDAGEFAGYHRGIEEMFRSLGVPPHLAGVPS